MISHLAKVKVTVGKVKPFISCEQEESQSTLSIVSPIESEGTVKVDILGRMVNFGSRGELED